MIIRLIVWTVSVVSVLTLGVVGFVYYSLTSGDGFSSEYVTAKIAEEVQHRIPNATISIGGAEFFLDIKKFAIAVRAKDVDIAVPDTVSASIIEMRTTISINSLLNRQIIIDNVHLQKGTITYEKPSADENVQTVFKTVPSTQTDVDTHIDTNKRIANVVSMVGYQVSTKLRDLINTTAQDIDISYKDKGMWAKIQLDSMHFSNDNQQQRLSYVADIDTQFFVDNPFYFGTVEGTVQTTFAPQKTQMQITTKGITRDFISGIDMSYSTATNTLSGDFYNHINDPQLVSFVRSFVPFVKAEKSLALNGQTDAYALNNGGGVLNIDYKADTYYGTATFTDIDNGWHIQATADNLTDDLVQHYGKGFMKQSTLEWMRDNLQATYSVTLDLVFDKTQKKFVKTIADTVLTDAKSVYKKGLPKAHIPLARVHMQNGITDVTANTATITANGKVVTLNNISIQNKNDILTTKLDSVGDVDTLTALVFNDATKLKNPYAFATLKQGQLHSTLQTTFDNKNKKMIDFVLDGTVAELYADYARTVKDMDIKGTAKITNVTLSARPNTTIVRATAMTGTANDIPVTVTDIALDIKNNVLWYGAHVRGDMSTLISPVLGDTITLQQGAFDGKVSLKYYIDKKRISTYAIEGIIENGIVVAPYTFQGVKTPYTIRTQLMDIKINDEVTIFKGDVNIDSTAYGDIHFVKRQSATSGTFSGDIHKAFLANFVPNQYIQVRKDIPLTLSYNGMDFDDGTLKVTADLQNMDFALPILQWQKDKHAAANLVSTIQITPNKEYNISMLANIQGDSPFYLKTAIALDSKGLKTVDVSDVKFKDERFNLAGIRKNTKMYWQINADTLTRKTVQALLDTHKNTVRQQTFDMDVRFTLGKLIGYNGVAISPVEGHMIRENDTIRLFETRMTLTDTQDNNRLYIYYTPDKYRMVAENLGVFYGSISKTNIFGDGGRIAMVANADNNGVLQGRMEAKDVVITNTPGAVRLLKLFSVIGVFDALESKDIKFIKVKGDFRLKQGRFETDNISGLGTIGISGKGYADFKSKQLQVDGMILPTYKISSLISNIPIIGQLLTGVEGQGIFSQYYTAKGTFDDYKITVNPISLLTVGILRDIFAPLFGAEDVPLEVN